MFKDELSPLTLQLVKLSDKDLPDSEKVILANVIEILFDDISNGNSCSRLSEIANKLEVSETMITSVLQKSDLVAFYTKLTDLEPKPISYWQIGNDVLIYISRYFAYEKSIAENILLLTKSLPSIDQNLKQDRFSSLDLLSDAIDKPNKAQLQAIKHSVDNRFSIITGGPGTGKTTTVTLLLWVLYQIYGYDTKVQIAAPTGKAAKRVSDSIINSIKDLSAHIDISCFDKLIANKNNYSTIHKLLGTNSESIHFRHDKNNPLDIEILIIDESSMIGLPLFSKLLNALDSNKLKHIVFLGDKNQLSSVEEGYVFASLVNLVITDTNYNPQDLFDLHTEVILASTLTVGKRNSEIINNLANAILSNQNMLIETILEHDKLIHNLDLQKIIMRNFLDKNSLISYMVFMQNISNSPNEDDLRAAFKQFSQNINLCVTNTGIFGAENINLELERKIKQKYAIHNEWYTGRAIMVLQNDYINDVFNGDVGICILDNSNHPRIYFANGRSYIPELLPKFTLAYAITIHKSQGSEYENINIILPNVNNNDNLASLLNRNLIYTAITRAKNNLAIFADVNTVIEASNNLVSRNSGLVSLISNFR
ncbi:MAG: exodeoxyribonuclease V subunit alpha [Burkholderiales bacterium]|nr:exodeoxyribonuclease V subunit alpha [Burkholderiales bacterium]